MPPPAATAIVKFAGCYHGHVDALLVRAGSGALTLGVPDSPGVPAALAELTLVAEFNDVAGVRELLRTRGSEIAAVIVEPVAGNMGVVAPAAGFLEMLREETSRSGTLLVFDEVMTGFRVAWGGAQAALRHHPRPDLPRQDHRRRPAAGSLRRAARPDGAAGAGRAPSTRRARCPGIRSASPPASRPSRALRSTPDAYDRLERLGARAEQLLREALAEAGVAGCVNRVGSMLTLFIGRERS